MSMPLLRLNMRSRQLNLRAVLAWAIVAVGVAVIPVTELAVQRHESWTSSHAKVGIERPAAAGGAPARTH